MFTSSSYSKAPCIPTLSSSSRHEIAVIAIGCKAIQEPQFYASLHQEKIESGHDSNLQPGCEEFTGPGWDLIRSSANFDDTDEPKSSTSTMDEKIPEDLEDKIKGFSADITARAKENLLIHQAMQTFLRRYDNITKAGTFVNARLTSALHRFGWVFGSNTSSSQGGHFHRGRRIAINAKSTGRRRGAILNNNKYSRFKEENPALLE